MDYEINMNKKSGIYYLTSPSNKCYVGRSVNINRRISTYRNLNCKRQTKLYHALLKYGFENFRIQILDDK